MGSPTTGWIKIMDDFRVKRAARIEAEITVPGDKSISHRAVIIASIANGACVLRGFSPSVDCMRTVTAMRALEISIEQPEPETLIVHGNKRSLSAPLGEINCGNSGTTMRLLAGLLAGQSFNSRLVGDGSLSRRPMAHVLEPLRKMGAEIVAEGEHDTAPLRIEGRPLHGIDYTLPVASAQLKSALLIAGLFATGKTTLQEPLPTRNHTELIFNYFLVRTQKDDDGISIFGDQVPESRDFLRDLNEHATQRELVYVHRWRQYDLVIWDNRQTMHRVRRFDESQPRDMRRTTVAGEAMTVEQAVAA